MENRKPIISLSTISKGIAPEFRGKIGIDNSAQHISIFNKSDQIHNRIGELQPDSTYHYYCRNEWGLHDVIMFVANQIGSCNLCFCTWSIGNEAIIMLEQCKRMGLFSSISAILSTRVRHNHPDIYQAATNAFNKVVLEELHAKVAVLENNDWCVSVFGSSNMTLNPRIERNTITTNKTISQADKKFLMDIIDKV